MGATSSSTTEPAKRLRRSAPAEVTAASPGEAACDQPPALPRPPAGSCHSPRSGGSCAVADRADARSDNRRVDRVVHIRAGGIQGRRAQSLPPWIVWSFRRGAHRPSSMNARPNEWVRADEETLSGFSPRRGSVPWFGRSLTWRPVRACRPYALHGATAGRRMLDHHGAGDRLRLHARTHGRRERRAENAGRIR
jgi:hypothetical protein